MHTLNFCWTCSDWVNESIWQNFFFFSFFFRVSCFCKYIFLITIQVDLGRFGKYFFIQYICLDKLQIHMTVPLPWKSKLTKRSIISLCLMFTGFPVLPAEDQLWVSWFNSVRQVAAYPLERLRLTVLHCYVPHLASSNHTLQFWHLPRKKLISHHLPGSISNTHSPTAISEAVSCAKQDGFKNFLKACKLGR